VFLQIVMISATQALQFVTQRGDFDGCLTCPVIGGEITVVTVEEMGRRDEVIAEATALLRESGPSAMTSVNVASRLGVTQSAIYRHIRDMDELNELASYAVVNELNSVMMAAFSAPETAWGDGAHFAKFAERVVGLMVDHQQGFAVIDRWRYLDGVLGEGIRILLDAGADLVAGELEIAWRGGFSYDGDFDGATRAAQLAHAQLIIDDAVAVARGVGTGTAAQRRKVTRMLSLRFFAGWCGYVQEMNRRLGVATPLLGSPSLPSPVGIAPSEAVCA